MLVFVEERHIKMAGRTAFNCPVALAIIEQIGYPTVVHKERVKICYGGRLLPEIQPTDVIYQTSDLAKQFISRVDENNYVYPRPAWNVGPGVLELLQIPIHRDYR